MVKFAGACYLVYLGVTLLLDRRTGVAPSAEWSQDGGRAIYRAGFLTNLLNPKVALFFMAFLPQFVAPDAESRILTFLFLGGLFICTGTIWCLVLAWGASTMSRRLRENPSASALLKRVTGAVFVGLGVRLAASQ